jgi:mono/diheme cytochrome c family protein
MVKWMAIAAATAVLVGGCGSSSGSHARTTPVRRVVQVAHASRDRWTYARERFREQCGGCHTLADAGTRGRRFNFDHDGKIDEARARFAIAEGEPGMPPWGSTLTRREFEELVAYLVAVQRPIGTGETNWHWQAELRIEGARWTPDQAGRGRDWGGGPTDPSGISTNPPLEPRTQALDREERRERREHE